MNLSLVVANGGDAWLVGELPALLGCNAQSRTIEELRANIREAAEGLLQVEHEKARGLLVIGDESGVERVTA